MSSHISMMRQLGISDDPVVAVENLDLLSPREKSALAYTEVVTRDSNRVTDKLFGELKEHFTDPEIVELTFLIGFINMLNRFNNALGIRYKGDFDAKSAPVKGRLHKTSYSPPIFQKCVSSHWFQ